MAPFQVVGCLGFLVAIANVFFHLSSGGKYIVAFPSGGNIHRVILEKNANITGTQGGGPYEFL